MPMTKVKADQHGVYFRTNGSVFRPYATGHETMIDAVVHGNTKFVAGQEVKIKNIAYTPHASIGEGPDQEIWNSHGSYFEKPAKECWIPRNG